MLFESLDWWWDPVPRTGAETMAIDEWLLGSAERPTLRVYGWDGMWGSVGYFGDVEAASGRIPGRRWVRRWTGGGVVDHVDDWTYTVVIPAGERWAREPAGQRYRTMHEVLVKVLAAEGMRAELARDAKGSQEVMCFRHPVSFDVVEGRTKLAGAGQRRTRRGVLHQGSVAGRCDPDRSIGRAENLARGLCPQARCVEIRLPGADELEVFSARYR